ncbi:MAG: glycoside hydrolase family 13 protein [Ignavibacteriaceae bacterium]
MNRIKILTCFFLFTFTGFSQSKIPEWAKGVIWYQIFPERFANGDLSNDPEPEKVFINEKKIPQGWKIREWTSNWFEPDFWELKAGGNIRDHLYERRYGGDIRGIIDKLDYLSELGIEAIYLNPVFEAVSLHKYDGSSFHHIDVNFGPDPKGDRKLIQSEDPDDPKTWVWTAADKLFLKLIEEVHKRNMRIIIDGVFNHTGVQFWAFQDIVKNGKLSRFKDWYIVHSFDNPETIENEFDYEGWWGIKSLPEFNRTDNDLMPGPKQYIFHSTGRWMDPDDDGDPSDGIDGWRLDVAREVPIGFWNDWRKLVKTLNPEAIIIGELWELSPDFVSQEGPFDALMNYNFAFAVNDFLIADKKKIPVSGFIAMLEEINRTYPEENLNVLQNLLSSHDTERLSSMINNPDRRYDRDANEGNPDYNPAKPGDEVYSKQKLIAAFQFTYPGAPMIYYGDEVGMWGADDPHCRKPMLWGELDYDDEIISPSSGFRKGFGVYTVKPDSTLFSFYQQLIRLRRNNPALKTGSFSFISSNDKKSSFAFERRLEDNLVIVIINAGSETDEFTIPLYDRKFYFKELLTGEYGSVETSGEMPAKFETSVNAGDFRIYQFIKSD